MAYGPTLPRPRLPARTAADVLTRAAQRRPPIYLRQQSPQILRHVWTLKPHTAVRNQRRQHPLQARSGLSQRLWLHLGLIEQLPPERANPAIEARPRTKTSAITRPPQPA